MIENDNGASKPIEGARDRAGMTGNAAAKDGKPSRDRAGTPAVDEQAAIDVNSVRDRAS